MSVKAMTWAREQATGDSTRKLLLMMLADHAGTNNVCWPSIDRLAADCECSHDTIRRHLRALEQLKLIETRARQRKNGSQTSSLYRVMVPPYFAGAGGRTGAGGNRTTSKNLAIQVGKEDSGDSGDYAHDGDDWLAGDDEVPQ